MEDNKIDSKPFFLIKTYILLANWINGFRDSNRTSKRLLKVSIRATAIFPYSVFKDLVLVFYMNQIFFYESKKNNWLVIRTEWNIKYK